MRREARSLACGWAPGLGLHDVRAAAAACHIPRAHRPHSAACLSEHRVRADRAHRAAHRSAPAHAWSAVRQSPAGHVALPSRLRHRTVRERRLTQIDLPYPVHARLAALAEDGSRVSANLWDAAGQRPYVWSRDLRSGRSSLNVAQLPVMRPDDLRSWSPDARHLLVSPGCGDGSGHGDLYQFALDGTADRRGVLGERLHAYYMRGADEITLVTSPKPVGTTPLGRATLWSWARGEGLVKLFDADLFWPYASWSPDGSRLALVGLDGIGRSPVVQAADMTASGTAVSPRTLMHIADLVAQPEGCPYGRGDVGLSRERQKGLVAGHDVVRRRCLCGSENVVVAFHELVDHGRYHHDGRLGPELHDGLRFREARPKVFIAEHPIEFTEHLR